MKIHLSNNAYLRNFDSFLRDIDTSDSTHLEITTNDHWIHVHPVVLTLVSALALKVGSDNVTIDEVRARSGHYLEAMGLFELIDKPSPYPSIEKHEASGRFVPLTQIKTQKDQSRFVSDIVPLLHLQNKPEQADTVRYTIGELLRNVLEHAESPDGAIVAAQYSQKSNTIRIGICDTGIGIRKSMASTWPGRTRTDIDAIKWALVPGVSGTTLSTSGNDINGGAGLFITKSISMLTRNYFVIYSGTGVYRLLQRRPDVKKIKLRADPADDRHTETNEAPKFEGTLVGIDISLDKIDEFATLLAHIRDVYWSAVKERKKERFKRPKFS
jgi:anti-sigma regulatory factor (Ser/Thr protein kinase)